MKFLETHFEDYINSSQINNLHPKLEKIFQKFPSKISLLKNVIFYGPSGVGKYTQMLRSIKKYSPSELKYEKKITITFNKQSFFLKISDIHFEVDMALLGCNSKLLWHEIYQQLIDIISAKTEKFGIIVCKNFQDIHNELLENFYSYMQHNNFLINITFFIITESVSFIPENILNCCEIINIPRPTKNNYSKTIKTIPVGIKEENIKNIKNIHTSITDIMTPHKIICDKIIQEIITNDIKFVKFRDIIYDIFIYHLNITDCIWYINYELIKMNKITSMQKSKILIKTFSFLKYFNNNYRPIYHLENYLFYLINIVHGFGDIL